jgi:hypothetical protein
LSGLLWTASYLLMGLRYPPQLITRLLQGVRGMNESTTYQAILAEGEARGGAEGLLRDARKIPLRTGTKRFGAPHAASKAKVESMSDMDRLEDLIDRVGSAGTWHELLSGS